MSPVDKETREELRRIARTLSSLAKALDALEASFAIAPKRKRSPKKPTVKKKAAPYEPATSHWCSTHGIYETDPGLTRARSRR